MQRTSKVPNPCLFVWETCIAMQGARRRDVIAACVAAGVSYGTARTQYQAWYSATKAHAVQQRQHHQPHTRARK